MSGKEKAKDPRSCPDWACGCSPATDLLADRDSAGPLFIGFDAI
jgi:hypothetical protein